MTRGKHKTRNQENVLLHTTLHTITRNYSKNSNAISKRNGVFFERAAQPAHWEIGTTLKAMDARSPLGFMT